MILIRGDITKIKADAIVNAANSSLLGGGGVDGAIHRAGGKSILEECMAIRAKQGGCATGQAVITTGGNLPSKYVIHTVGPIWNDNDQAKMMQLLLDCYYNSLDLAVNHIIRTIAFPNISTGIYRFPKLLAANVAINACREFLQNHPDTIDQLMFVCFDEENYRIYEKLL